MTLPVWLQPAWTGSWLLTIAAMLLSRQNLLILFWPNLTPYLNIVLPAYSYNSRGCYWLCFMPLLSGHSIIIHVSISKQSSLAHDLRQFDVAIPLSLVCSSWLIQFLHGHRIFSFRLWQLMAIFGKFYWKYWSRNWVHRCYGLVWHGISHQIPCIGWCGCLRGIPSVNGYFLGTLILRRIRATWLRGFCCLCPHNRLKTDSQSIRCRLRLVSQLVLQRFRKDGWGHPIVREGHQKF